VILRAPGSIAHDSLENFENRAGLDAQTGLFEDFPHDGLFQTLPGFDQAAGNRPITFEWIAPAFDK
jgi:hypothetical protein